MTRFLAHGKEPPLLDSLLRHAEGYVWPILSRDQHGEKKSFKGFSILAQAGILLNGAKRFVQSWYRVTEGIFLYSYFRVHPLVKAEKSFKGFLFLALVAILFNGAERFKQYW